MSDEEGEEETTSIRRARVALGLTATEAAARLGIERGYLSKLELHGTACWKRLDYIARAYGCKTTALMLDNPAITGRGRKSKKA